MKKIIFFLMFANLLFANDTSVTSGQTVSGHVNQGKSNYYLISASRGDTIKSLLKGLNDNADLYVRVGARPTSSSYDCKSTNGSTENDACSVTVDHDATVYVRVYGRKGTNYQIRATKSNGGQGNDTTIVSGQTVSGHVNRGKSNYYLISASRGDTITSNLKGLGDNADLYVRVGAKPTSSRNHCRSINGGRQNESCSVTLTRDATVYVRVHGRRATNYQVTVTKSHGGGNNGAIKTLTSGQTISSSIRQGEEKHYRIRMGAGQSLDSLITHLTADNDLYVRMGKLPTGNAYDCKSSNRNTQDDGCSITATQNTIAYITVYGYRAGNYTLTATRHNGGGGRGDNITTLVSGEVVSSSVARNAMKYYKINVKHGERVRATISELTNHAHIYLRKGSKPTRSSYDCRAVKMGVSSNSCSLNISSDTEVFIGVSGFRASDYLLTVTTQGGLIPANPEIPTVLEDAEGGTLNPNWQVVLGNEPGYIYPTPHIPGAPSGSGVLVHHATGVGTLYRYHLPVNNNSQRVLSMDMGGLPNHKYNNDTPRGFIPHYGVGVIVETKFGRRIMTWDSWYKHQGYPPRKHDNGHNIFLNYPSPVEMVRGYGYAPTNLWTHFEVNLDDALHELEPNNEIIKIIIFHTTGGYLDNITLSAAN